MCHGYEVRNFASRVSGTVSVLSFSNANPSFLHGETFHRENANSDYDTRSYLWHHEAEAGINESCRITLTLVSRGKRGTRFLCVTTSRAGREKTVYLGHFSLFLFRSVIAIRVSPQMRDTCIFSKEITHLIRFLRISIFYRDTRYDHKLFYIFLQTRNLAPIATCPCTAQENIIFSRNYKSSAFFNIRVVTS